MYFWEGLKRVLCCCCYKPTEKIKSILSRFSVQVPSEGEEYEEIKNIDNREFKKAEEDIENSLNSSTEEKVLFAANSKEAVGNEYVLRGNPMSVVCSNIESIMGGRCSVWKAGKGRMGL